MPLLAVGAVLLLTALVLGGIRRSNWLNILIVCVTLAALAAFILTALPAALRSGETNLSPLIPEGADGGAHAFL